MDDPNMRAIIFPVWSWEEVENKSEEEQKL